MQPINLPKLHKYANLRPPPTGPDQPTPSWLTSTSSTYLRTDESMSLSLPADVETYWRSEVTSIVFLLGSLPFTNASTEGDKHLWNILVHEINILAVNSHWKCREIKSLIDMNFILTNKLNYSIIGLLLCIGNVSFYICIYMMLLIKTNCSTDIADLHFC